MNTYVRLNVFIHVRLHGLHEYTSVGTEERPFMTDTSRTIWYPGVDLQKTTQSRHVVTDTFELGRGHVHFLLNDTSELGRGHVHFLQCACDDDDDVNDTSELGRDQRPLLTMCLQW